MIALVRIALRNVLRNRRRSLLTLSAVFISVGVMVSVRGLLNGLHGSIRDGVIQGQTGAIQIHRKGYLKSVQGAALDLDLPADDAFLARLAAVPGVTAVAPRIAFGGMANANDQTVVSLFMAFDPAREPRVCPARGDAITDGKPLSPEVPDGADLSTELVRRIGVKKGATVALLTNDQEGVLNAVEVKVAGLMGEGTLPMPDKKVAFMPLAVAQELLRMPGRATEIAVAVADLDRLGEIVPRVAAVAGPDLEVATWREVAKFVDQLIHIQDFSLNAVSYTFAFIALLGIANTMLMNVMERRREIGTMMSLGLRRIHILALFLVEAALLGLAGGVAGAGLGLAFVLHFNATGIALTNVGSSARMLLHPWVSIPWVLAVFAVAAVGAALAALYPAWRASRLRPIEALAQT